MSLLFYFSRKNANRHTHTDKAITVPFRLRYAARIKYYTCKIEQSTSITPTCTSHVNYRYDHHDNHACTCHYAPIQLKMRLQQ